MTLPDGSVLVSSVPSSRSAPTWRVWPDGRRERVRGFDATGLAVSPDGSVLAVDGTAGVVRHWVPEGQPTVVAGGGMPGFGGDGGPATAAGVQLNIESWGVRPLADGGFVFADTGNHRIRSVDGSGVITTIAGSLPGSFELPTGLAPWRDGGYVVADQDRLRVVHPDGRVETLVGSDEPARDVESLADGAVLWTSSAGRLRRLALGARHPEQLLRSGATHQWDFAARP